MLCKCFVFPGMVGPALYKCYAYVSCFWDVWSRLYKCYANVLCFLGFCIFTCKDFVCIGFPEKNGVMHASLQVNHTSSQEFDD